MSVSPISSPLALLQRTTPQNPTRNQAAGATANSEQVEGAGPDHDGDSDDATTANWNWMQDQATQPSYTKPGTGLMVNKLA